MAVIVVARRGDRSTSFDKDSSRPTSHVENTLQRHLIHHIARAQHDIIPLYIDYVITISILSQSMTHPSSYGRLTLKQTLSNKDNITIGL